MKILYAIPFIFCALLSFPAHAQESTFPQAASLKRSEVYVRSGPGTRYPILWIFQRKGWPVTILNKYDNWFKIKDVEGEEGWVYVGMVSHKETALITSGQPVLLSKKPNGEQPLLKLSAGVIVTLEDCAQDAPSCRVSYNEKVGYLSPDRIIRPKP